MKTTANVYLISTNKEHERDGLYFVTSRSTRKENLGYTYYGHNPQHMYITLPQSDLEISKIREGDWFYNNLFNIVEQLVKEGRVDDDVIQTLNNNPHNEKIIAATDEGLSHIKQETYPNGNTTGVRSLIELPSIPKSFIEHYISEYDNGNQIKQVDVELEEVCRLMSSDIVKKELWYKVPNTSHVFQRLKLTPNNEISIVMHENKFGKIPQFDITLDTINVLLHSKRHEFSDLNAFRRVQNEFVELFSAVTPVEKMYTKEEVVILCLKIHYEYIQYKKDCHYGPNMREIAEWTDNWIEENLK